MGLTATVDSGTKREPTPEGMHLAICYGVVDLGTHTSDIWQKDIHKMFLCFEMPELRLDIERDGQSYNLPRVISKKYTLSLHEKSLLHKDLVTWRGRLFTDEELRGFDIKNVLLAGCQLQIVHNHAKNGKTYANIATVIPLANGVSVPHPENDVLYYSMEEHTEIPKEIPDWMGGLIRESSEWQDAQQSKKPIGNKPNPDLLPSYVSDDDDETVF